MTTLDHTFDPSRTASEGGRARRRSLFLLATAVLLLLANGGCEPAKPRFVRQLEWAGAGTWVKADTHIHTKFSDGANTVSEVADQARRHGCDVIAITDHADANLKAASHEYAEAIAVARRQHPTMIILGGLEWNVPPWGGDEHATVLFPPGSDEFLMMAEFKAQFDDLGRDQHDARLAADALRWLDERGRTTSVKPVMIYNHPGRKSADSAEAETRIRSWYGVNDVVVGLSGAPGHQQHVRLGAYKGPVQPIDRWDPAVAEVGGVWDRLLRDGIDVWGARAASDFHTADSRQSADYWPGEFSETWLYVPERTPNGVLRAFRAGAFFAAHGHIARKVELTVALPELPRPAQVGEVIEAPGGTGLNIQLTAEVPSSDWRGAPNTIDLIELIVTDESGSRVIPCVPAGAGQVSVQKMIAAPASGPLVVRARGRRTIYDGPDLLFYTNPIRVQINGSSQAWLGGGLWGLVGLPMFLVIVASIAGVAWRRGWLHRLPGWRPFVKGTHPAPASLNRDAAPRRRHFAIAAGLFAGFAIYGSLVPLRYAPVPWDEAVAQFQVMMSQPVNADRRVDWATNVLLMLPVSFCLLATIALDRRGSLRWLTWSVPIIVACGALSCGIEFSQFFFRSRVPSHNDVVAQILGALAGCGVWLAIGQKTTDWLRRYSGAVQAQDRADWLLQAYLVGMIVYSLSPFDLTVHPGDLYRKYQAGKIVLIPALDQGAGMLWGRLIDALLFVPVGVLATRLWLTQQQTIRSMRGSILIGALIALGIEMAQLCVLSRYTSAVDVLTGTIGTALGVRIAHGMRAGGSFDAQTSKPTRFARGTLAALGAIVMYSGLLCTVFWWPFEGELSAQQAAERMEGFLRVPFTALFWGSEFNAVTQVLRKVLYFVPLGAAFGYLVNAATRSDDLRRLLSVVAVVYCIGLATAIELVQAFYPPHVCDITDAMFYSLGGVGGMVLWRRSFGATQGISTTRGNSNFLLVSQKRRSESTCKRGKRWRELGLAAAFAGVVLVWFVPRGSTSEAVLRPHTYEQLTGSVFLPTPHSARLVPTAREIEIPRFLGADAIWGATGRDTRGHIWFGVSAARIAEPSAHLFELDPATHEVIDRGSVTAELERAGLLRPGEGQMKIHSKIVQADDGHLYFSSMDEQGEQEDGSRLPTWGSHLWRYRIAGNQWEHLASVPEGLIAVGGVGRRVYALGLFGHVLYQFDTSSKQLRKVRVGSVGGHISRNLIADEQGHVYVPRLRETVVSAGRNVILATLVEFDEELREVRETPLPHYFKSDQQSGHGIVGFCYLSDKSIVLTTDSGHLYQVRPSGNGTAADVRSLGWIHPDGESYTPSLFTLAGARYLLGVGKRPGGDFEWLTFDLLTGRSLARTLGVPHHADDVFRRNPLALYGSLTRDDSGGFYIVGRYGGEGISQPILVRLSLGDDSFGQLSATAGSATDYLERDVE